MNWRISKVGYRLLLTLYHLKDFNDSNGFNGFNELPNSLIN